MALLTPVSTVSMEDHIRCQVEAATEEVGQGVVSTHRDARDELLASAESKLAKAAKHFNKFLVDCSGQDKWSTGTVEHNQMPFEGTDTERTKKAINQFWDSLFGCFFYYLANHARQFCDDAKPLVSYNTATGCTSSMKKFYADRFRNESFGVHVFAVEAWKELRVRLLGAFRERQRKAGKALEEPHIASTEADRKATAVGCTWTGTRSAAEFWHLSNTGHQCCGRASETLLIQVNDVDTTTVREGTSKCELLKLTLQRQKDGPHQDTHICPHRDSMEEDFCFSLLCHCVMGGVDGQCVFPDFAEKAPLTRKDKSESRVS